MNPKIGIIGGSGLYSMPGFEVKEEVLHGSPWGDPSDKYIVGELAGKLDFERLLWKASTGTRGTGTISGTGTSGGTGTLGTGTVESNPKSTELRDETRKHLERIERDKA